MASVDGMKIQVNEMKALQSEISSEINAVQTLLNGATQELKEINTGLSSDDTVGLAIKAAGEELTETWDGYIKSFNEANQSLGEIISNTEKKIQELLQEIKNIKTK